MIKVFKGSVDLYEYKFRFHTDTDPVQSEEFMLRDTASSTSYDSFGHHEVYPEVIVDRVDVDQVLVNKLRYGSVIETGPNNKTAYPASHVEYLGSEKIEPYEVEVENRSLWDIIVGWLGFEPRRKEIEMDVMEKY